MSYQGHMDKHLKSNIWYIIEQNSLLNPDLFAQDTLEHICYNNGTKPLNVRDR